MICVQDFILYFSGFGMFNEDKHVDGICYRRRFNPIGNQYKASFFETDKGIFGTLQEAQLDACVFIFQITAHIIG